MDDCSDNDSDGQQIPAWQKAAHEEINNDESIGEIVEETGDWTTKEENYEEEEVLKCIIHFYVYHIIICIVLYYYHIHRSEK